MRLALWIGSLTVITLAGCAGQTPADQITRKETVRVCQGQQCTDQHRSTVTFQAPPSDPESEQRLAQLEQLAQRSPQAAYDLALRLLRGDGVARNSHQATEWMRQAGDAGLVEAQLALGRMYLGGYEEMGTDPAEAYAWLSRAAAAGSQEARQLAPQAQAAQQDEKAHYQVREAYRTSWGHWYATAPYYWVWGSTGWLPR